MLSPPLPARGCALFFDFDGTLVDIAPRPDAVCVAPAVLRFLPQLQAAHGGALAIVSGRPVSEIDAFLHPMQLPVAGVHGVERRGADGVLQRMALPDLGPAKERVHAFVALHPGLQLELKPGAMALHYRGAPELEDACVDVMTQAQALVNGPGESGKAGLGLMCGKRVVELKPRRASKGAAVMAFMAEAPFSASSLTGPPWVFGDDVTDEAAFETVLALGGVAVKIGEGESLAPFRLPDPAALHDWIEQGLKR